MQWKFLNQPKRRAGFATAVLTVFLGTGGAAMAQSYGTMSCSQLWYARNAIYAQAGYCFQTARARAVFGAACFPPYGNLTAWQQREVNNIIAWERRRGC
ncbi:MAG: YARHG domain-containing protein [Parvibaculaceae bacterium]